MARAAALKSGRPFPSASNVRPSVIATSAFRPSSASDLDSGAAWGWRTRVKHAMRAPCAHNYVSALTKAII